LAASWQDRDGAKTALLSVYLFTPIRCVFADQGFAGRLVEWAARTLRMVIDIVRKPDGQRGWPLTGAWPATRNGTRQWPRR
jgi:hypothetical protein